jgi:ribose transport system substrate-binding protein
MFIPGGNTPFWQLTVAGAEAAAEEYGIQLSVALPEGGHQQQSKILEKIAPNEFDGIAISPRAPEAQNELLSKLAKDVHLITFDSDAPDSDRLCYVGTDNYSAGRLSARLVKEAVPEGGTIALLVANFEKDNAVLRVKGFQDEMQRYLAVDTDTPLFEILEPMEDGIDKSRCRENITRALQQHPDVAALVGMFSYHGPILLDVVKNMEEGKKPQLITFDEEDVVLDGIQSGQIYATVVQDPFKYGFESVRMIAALKSGSMMELPIAGNGSLFLPCEAITPENVAEFRRRLATRLKP